LKSTTARCCWLAMIAAYRSGVVVGGLTFGMPMLVVTPPRAAAVVAEVMSSLCVNPGSR
jgi:hypothetical protein